MQGIAATGADGSLLSQVQRYLASRADGPCPHHDLEDAWTAFFKFYTHRIRKYAFSCGAADEDIADCIQEVWAELLVRLPTFQLDSARGRFDSWLFRIVRGKTANLQRSRKHRLLQENGDTFRRAVDEHPGPGRALEEAEICGLAWERLRNKLSDCNLQILHMRLVEELPAAEVARKLGLTQQQVWYRFHRARRDVEAIGSALARGRQAPMGAEPPFDEDTEKDKESAQGKQAYSVSRNVGRACLVREGGHGVDYVFQRLELGRRELAPEWKVEWNLDDIPRPVLYIRKMAIVAYAEICAVETLFATYWPRIVNAAIAAGVAAGVATIITTPTAALPIFRRELQKQLQGKEGGSSVDDSIQVALSAKQEANGPWCECKL